MSQETKNSSEELLVYGVPEAGAKLGLSRNASYQAAARGDIPTIRFGRLLKVPRSAFDRLLAGKHQMRGD
jgi:excisionase family DNA binding protein